MLYQYPFAKLMGDHRIFGEWCVRQYSQIVDVREIRVAKPKAKDVENPFGAMDGSTVVREAASEHACAQLGSDSKHLD